MQSTTYPSIFRIIDFATWLVDLWWHYQFTKDKKYLSQTAYPLMKAAYRKGDVNGSTLALYEDRINMRRNRIQVYGTQIIKYKGRSMPYPIYNLDSLDSYRKAANFDFPLDIYLKHFNGDWNPVEYRTLLPILTKGYKVNNDLPIRAQQ